MAGGKSGINLLKKKNKQPIKKNMTVFIDTEYYEFLKKLSYKLSAKENQRIGISEVVRRALESRFPFRAD